MIDGSQLPYEENVAISKSGQLLMQWVFRLKNWTIGALENSSEGGAETITPLNRKKFKILSQERNVDSLTIAIGTAHGIYQRFCTPITLRFTLKSEP